MRKLNVRFLAVLVGVVVLSAGGLYLIHFFQQDRIAAAQLWQAQSAREAEQFDKAASHYERYLEFRPDDTTVMTSYAEMLEQQLDKQPAGTRNPRKIVYLLEEVLNRDGSRVELRRRLVKLYLYPRMRRYKDAESHLDLLQRQFPEDGSLWQQRAICQENLGQLDAAAESLQKGTRFPPDPVRCSELLAGLLRRQLNRASQADDVIREMVTQHASSHEAHLARARYKIEFGLGDVSTEAKEAIRLAPDNAEAILLHARVLHQQKKIPEAIAVLERGLTIYPADARMYRHLAWIEYFTKKHDSARERLQTGIVNCPDAFDLHTALAELLIQAKMFDQVQKIITDLKTKGVREERLTYLTARIAVERGQWPEAVGLLEKLRPQVRNNADLSVQLNLLLAQCHKQLGDNDRQLESLKRVLDFDAQSLQARTGIAALYASTNRLNEAIREYEQLVSLMGTTEAAACDMVRLMIVRKLRSPSEKQGWPEIERTLTAIEKRHPNSTEVLLARSDLLAAKQKPQDADTLLAGARESNKDVRLWMQSAHYAEVARRGGLEVIDEAVRKLGDQPDLRLKRAALLVGRSPSASRRELRDLEKPAESYTEEQRAQLLTGIGELYFMIQDYPASRRLFQQLAAERVSDLHARVMLVEIALRENDREALPGLLAEVRRIEPPGGTMLPMLETRHLLAVVEEGDRSAGDKARALLKTLQQQRPSWPLVHQGLGRLAEADGDKAQAIEHFRQAVQLGDADLRTHHRLIRLLVEGKREAEAEQVLATASQQGTLPLEKQRRMLADASPMLKSAVVQQHIQQTVTRDASDPNELIWLGKMMWDTGNRAKALEAFRTATERASHVPDFWVTRVQALAADGKTEEATRVMNEARQKLPPDLSGRTMAQCLELMRQYDAAMKEYAAALRDQPTDPLLLRRYIRLLISLGHSKVAVNVLEQIVAKPGVLAREDVAWARRNLAILGAAERSPEQYQRAMTLLKSNSDDSPSALEDMRARVVLLSQQPPTPGEAKTPRQQAIELLEKIVQHAQAGREDRFALAKLYDSERDWTRAEKQYRAVIAADARDPMPAAHLARRLLQLGKLAEARELVAQIEKIVPGSPLHVNLRSRLQFLSGETERLIADLTNYASSEDKAFLAGSLLDEFVRSAANPRPASRDRMRETSLLFYERCIRQHPEAVVRMVGLWSYAGQRDLAIRWLRDPRMKIPLNLRASAEIAALRSGHASDAECKSVEKWLRESAAKSPEIELDLHLADLAEMRHDFQQAEELLRGVLKKDAGQIVAMNNLAWVLAHRGPSREALALVQKAISMVGPIPDLLDTRAKVYVAMGRTAEAAQDLEDAIADSPTAMRYFQLALAREQGANPGGARDAFQLAVQLGFDSRDLHPTDLPMFERLKKSNG